VIVDATHLFSEIRDVIAEPAPADGIVTAAIVRDWLASGPRVFDGDDRAALDALCRQIDVRHRISRRYGRAWKRVEPEEAAPAAVVSGVAAVLLANAAGVGEPGPDGALNDGWGLKCVNSALKAVELVPDLPRRPELVAWAMTVLDRARAPEDGAA
jgi:hypothetical protein